MQSETPRELKNRKARENYARRMAAMTDEEREVQRWKWRGKNARERQRMTPERKEHARAESLRRLREWQVRHPERNKARAYKHRLRKDYGLTVAEYEKMYSEQWGMCPICGCVKASTLNNIGGKSYNVLCVDHCHDTGNVRALLCARCNKLIGHAGDDVTVLQNAVEYLQYFKSNPGLKGQHV